MVKQRINISIQHLQTATLLVYRTIIIVNTELEQLPVPEPTPSHTPRMRLILQYSGKSQM